MNSSRTRIQLVRAAKLTTRVLGIVLIVVSVGSVLLWIGYAKLNDRSLNPLTYSSCITETQKEIHNLAGADFSVEYTNCDTLAKDEAIRVFASRPVGAPIVGKWLKKKTLLFWYDPGSYGAALPTLTAPQPGRILIAIPGVSSIEVQKRQWNGRQIDYEVGHIDYP